MLRSNFSGGVPYPPRPGEPGVRYAAGYPPPGSVPPPSQPATYRDGSTGQVYVRQPTENSRGSDRRGSSSSGLAVRTVPMPYYPSHSQLADPREVQVLGTSGRGGDSLVTVPSSHLGLVQQQPQPQQQIGVDTQSSKRARMDPQPLRIDTREQKEPGYHPQVEAISPTPEDRIAERDDVRSTKDDLLQKISKVDREIAKAESQIAKLKKKQHDLEDAANRPTSDSANEDEKPGQSVAQSVYSENRRKAGQSHAILDKFTAKNDLPLYNQPSDTEVYSTNKKNYTVFKKKLVEYFKKRSDEREQRDRYMTNTYCRLTSQWTKKVDKEEGRKSRKEREGRAREQYEKIFPELRKQREDKERDARLGTRGVVKSDADIEDVIERLHEQEMEDKKMHSYAVIPPLLLPPDERRRKFTNNNGLMRDPMLIYKEREYVNMWTDAEKEIFREKYLQQPKNFSLIATYLERKTVSDCVQYYYLSKKTENYKQLLRKSRPRPRGQRRTQQPAGEVIGAGLSGVVTRRKVVEELQGKEAQEGTSKGNSRSNTPGPTHSGSAKGTEENGENDKDIGKKKPDRGRDSKKTDNQNDSSDEEDSNQAVKTGPHPCVVCKAVVDTSRAVQKVHASQLNIKEEELEGGDCRVCNTCWCKTLKKKHVSVCSVPSCTSSKGRNRGKLRHLPKKWSNLDKASRDIVMNEMSLPEKIKHVCTACFTRITRRINQLECSEQSNKGNKKEEEVVSWADDAIEKAKVSLRQYGTNWAKMVEAVKDKSEDQCKKFFYNQRKRLQLDKIVQEYKRANRPGSDDKPSLTSDEESGSSTSSCEEDAQGVMEVDGDDKGKDLKPPALPPTDKTETENKKAGDDYNSADTMSADETHDLAGGGGKKNQQGGKDLETVKGLMEAVITHTLDASKAVVTNVPFVTVTTATPSLGILLQDAGPSPRDLKNYVRDGLQSGGGGRPKEIGPPQIPGRSDQDIRQGQAVGAPNSPDDGVLNLTMSRPDRSSPAPVASQSVEHVSSGFPGQYGKNREPVPESQGKEPPAAHGGEKPKTSHKDLMMSLRDQSFPHMFRSDSKSPAPYADPRASVHSPGPLLVHRGDPRKELPSHGASKSHPPPLHPTKLPSGSSNHPSGLTVTPSRPGGSLTQGTPKVPSVHGSASSQHSPRYDSATHHPTQGSITKGQPVYRAQDSAPRRQHPSQHSQDSRSSSHPSLEAAYKAQQVQARGSPYSSYQSSPRPSSHEQPGAPRSSRSILESDYSIAQTLPKHPRDQSAAGFPRTIDPHGRRDTVEQRLDPRSDPRVLYSSQAQRFGPSFGGRGDPRAEVRGDPRAELPGARGDPRAEIPVVRGDPRSDRDQIYRDSRHDPRLVDPRSVPMVDPRSGRGPPLYATGGYDPRTLPRPRSPPRTNHPSQTSAPSPSGSITQGRPKPREGDNFSRHNEVSITKSLPGNARSDYANLDDLARIADTQTRLPDGRSPHTVVRDGGRAPPQGPPPVLDHRALYDRERHIQAERSKMAQDAVAAVAASSRSSSSNRETRFIEQQKLQNDLNRHDMMRTINQMSEQDQRACFENLKGRGFPPEQLSAANLIDLIITHQISRNTTGPNSTNSGPQQNPNPRRSPAIEAVGGKESPSKPSSHSPVVKSVPDSVVEMVASGSGGVRTSPGTMGEHIENMISKEVGRSSTGSPYPSPNSTEHEHWKRRVYPVQDGGSGYKSPNQPRPPSNSHPSLSTDERVIQRVVQNASPSSATSRPEKPPSRSMHEAISPPCTSYAAGASSLPPNTMYPGGQATLEPAMVKFLARKKEEAERAAAVSRSGAGVSHFDDYVKYKITEVMKNDKSSSSGGSGGSGAGPSEPKTTSVTMGPPHKRPLETETRGSPSEHPPPPGPESPNKRYKRDDTSNDMPDSPESGDMVIDESARPDSAHSQKTSSPAPGEHYPPGYRSGGSNHPRSSPAPASGSRQPPPPLPTSGGALARYEPLSDDD